MHWFIPHMVTKSQFKGGDKKARTAGKEVCRISWLPVTGHACHSTPALINYSSLHVVSSLCTDVYGTYGTQNWDKVVRRSAEGNKVGFKRQRDQTSVRGAGTLLERLFSSGNSLIKGVIYWRPGCFEKVAFQCSSSESSHEAWANVSGSVRSVPEEMANLLTRNHVRSLRLVV